MRAAIPALALAFLVGSLASVPERASAQEIGFSEGLPRTLVFIAERGDGGTAARDMTAFLVEAGFPVVDPALAQTAAQRALVEQALAGDEVAATNLGRDFGAQVLVIGRADWGARPDPVDGTLITATSEVSVRALRLDRGLVVAAASGDARDVDVTEQAARAKAVGKATTDLLQTTAFVGQLVNDWEAAPWQEAMYWVPDPGSVPSRMGQAQTDATPGLAILRADVAPATGGTTRGLGVVKKGSRSSDIFNPVRLEGVVVGDAVDVQVEGKPANLEVLDPGEAERLGLAGMPAQKFWAETILPLSQDSISITATGIDGSVASTVAAPRIDERWAVVIGVSQYESEDIPDLEFAEDDAQAVYDFLTSSAAGPFDEDHVLFLKNEEATGAAMREALFVFLQDADWDDLVMIYYAGHGAPDPNRPDNLYLLPYDSDLDAMAATAFPMWDVKTALRRQISAERVVVIADACHSAGTQGDGTWSGEDSDNPINGGFAELFTPSRRLSITAADTNEFSLEDSRWEGHGVFTYFLLEALRGDGDMNGDGIVTFSEAYDYVANSVTAATEGRQNPQRSGFGDVPLAVVGESDSEDGAGGR
jgi:hypothetical protein